MIQRACKQLKSIKTSIIPVQSNYNNINKNLTIKSSFQSNNTILFPQRFNNTLKFSFAEDKRTDAFKKKLSK